MSAVDLEALMKEYLDAFHARDLERCMRFFADDAAIDFQIGVFRGRAAIEEWHKERFAADLKMVRLNSITVKGDTVLVDGIISSTRLASWKIKSLGGRLTVLFEDGKIKHGKVNAKASNPFKFMHSEG